MELRQLRHFVAVVDIGNLSRAAERVAISQPALTRSIKNLEDMLGVRLLERQPRGVVPTEAGLALYHHANVILNACQHLTREVRELERGIVGSVRLGVASMFAAHVVDQVAVQLSREHPRLALVITEGFFEDLVRALVDGRVDLIFSNFPQVAIAPDLVMEPLLTLSAPVLAGEKHPLARRREISRADLVDRRWVVVDQPHAIDALQRDFAAEGLAGPRDVLRTNSLQLMIALVESGEFLATLSEHLVQPQLAQGKIRALQLPGGPIERKAGLIYRQGVIARPGVGHVVEDLRRASAAFRTRAARGR